ncbi:MAG: hypothetical protein KatS3mg105_2400 [Gemmatales bacterium]|nr:MAG: hypothetical protein KatS3mg105_2400 [Gemmatales bacterium]
MPATPNRLIDETSPYLKQHAYNPVDWYPWCKEALAEAQKRDRPIFLSIGYSACHWCHVMEHESFENEDIAAILNDNFISIKVDREERPDLDQVYMTAVQMMTGQGGWPMSVFLTPDLKPFYGGTYFPPESKYGRPGFKQLLLALADAWKNRREEIEISAGGICEHLRKVVALEPAEGQLDEGLLRQAAAMLGRAFDPVHGGFGQAPKFPHPMELRVLLRVWKRFGTPDALTMVCQTLDRMAMGGIYDHLGGGFHRYSTDARWLVPHFEKMLYDNALLPLAYLEGYQATGQGFYREIVEETLDYVAREMTSPEGPFYSTQDADSEGVEGKFYVWSADEIEQILGAEEAKLFADVYDVSKEGNWEGKNILNRAKTYPQLAKLHQLDENELRHRLDESRRKLLEARGRRVWPGRDEKIITSWNGLMINTFAQAAQVLNRSDYAERATRAAQFILDRMRQRDGRLFRTYFAGSEPKLNAYLEDYAALVDALVSLYEATFAPKWLDAAEQIAEVMLYQFWDEQDGGFYFTGRDHEQLVARVKDVHDSSTPSGNALAVTALLRLARLTGRDEFWQKAEQTLTRLSRLLASSPLAAGQLLIALDFYLGPIKEFAVVGDLQSDEAMRVLAAIHARFLPNKVVAGGDGATSRLPLLKDKESKDSVTTYICENFACRAPLIGSAAVEETLQNI